MIVRISVAALLTAFSMLVPTDAFACVCASTGIAPSRAELTRQVQQELNRALVVFVGQPIAQGSLTVRFKVSSVWKGRVGPELLLASGAELAADGALVSSTCNFSFQLGQEYVVFAYGPTYSRMQAHSCTFTSTASDSRSIAVLNRIARRQPPIPSVAIVQSVAIVGAVKNPGLVPWRAGLTVADAIELAAGWATQAIGPVEGQTVKIWRVRKTIEEQIGQLTTVLQPDDWIFISGSTAQAGLKHR